VCPAGVATPDTDVARRHHQRTCATTMQTVPAHWPKGLRMWPGLAAHPQALPALGEARTGGSEFCYRPDGQAGTRRAAA
jgi:hypothetical protein